MSFPNETARFVLSFLVFILSFILALPIFMDLNSYAKSDNNNNENTSLLSSLSSSSISDIKEHKKSKSLIDANTSSLSSSSSASSSDSSNQTFDGKPQAGILVVTKQVINEGGGNKNPSDFTITVNGNSPTPSSFAGSSSGTTITINEGSYNVTEEEGPGISYDYVPGFYTPNYSSDCAGTIQGGDTIICTITNKYNPFIPGILSKLIVTKQVINEGGGEAEPSDFTITVDGNNPTPSSFDGSSSGTSVQLFEGRYKVTESGPNTNYSSTLSKECSGSIREGESKKCTITNTYSEPSPPITTAKIIVTKKVINEGGGNKKPSDFTITVDGNNSNSIFV